MGTSADSSVPISDDCEKAAKQEDLKRWHLCVATACLPSQCQACMLPSTEEGLGILQLASPLDEM